MNFSDQMEKTLLQENAFWASACKTIPVHCPLLSTEINSV